LHVIVQGICKSLQIQDSWRVEIAALLSQLGCVVLPPETSARAYANLPLTAQEQLDFQSTAKIASDLLANIPRLEPVSEMLQRGDKTEAPPSGPLTDCPAVTQGGEILRCATEFDRLSRTVGPHDALERMRDTTHPQLLTALGELELPWMGPVAESVALADLQPGMTLVRDARTSTGLLLAATGTKISEPLILLMRNSAQTDGVGLDEPLKVVYASHHESASAQGDASWAEPPSLEE
ncbi:MAG: HD domain-containing phosphohydrolase, partial [Planctomycetota bacterium]